tara:strand:+ start:2772 stop:3659 length:888 start_codon:yes stop_codon:yes gene_type:complete
VKEVLMILNPRAIPEAIESLNTLDIEKVWFRAFDEPSVCEAMNNFVADTDYDYYWIIADDVIVNNRPLEVLRPLIQEGKVVSGYCRWFEGSEYVNLLHKPISCVYACDDPNYQFLKRLNEVNPERYSWIQKVPEVKPDDDSVNDFMFYDMDSTKSRYFYDEVQSMGQEPIKTYFSGWSFTGASRDVWLKYPFMCSLMDSQSDIKFSVRYINDDGGEIFSHKEAYFHHMKKNTNILVDEWKVGVEPPTVYRGTGFVDRSKIKNQDIIFVDGDFSPKDRDYDILSEESYATDVEVKL